MPDTIIKVENLSKKFGKHQILKNIDLEIKQGDIYGIIGMSGSGKSTLLNLLTDLLTPDTGKISYKLSELNNFYQLSQKPEEIKKLFGYSFQDPSFHSMLTVQENLEHFATLYGLPKKFGIENTNVLLKLVELDEAKHSLGKDISGGMQKRLCFACSLIHSPKILFLDEPTSNLDPVLRKETWDILKKINKNGTTIVIASQLLTELETFCDRICIINNGEIIKEGTVDKVKQEYTSNIEIHLESLPGNYDVIIQELKEKNLPIPRTLIKESKLIIYTPEAEKVLHTLLHIIEKNKETLLDIDLNKPSLAEVFESLVSKK
ncbi:ABC transporter ATP-binding protein [Candidatus Woesearchaeota archaeon]|nr:ABC transporter ATP-binding protein [Candidatus Woesearchaeota archaeon]